jgi:hypothetical protein
MQRTSPSGHGVLVGRNARENARVTAAMAGHHLWFHLNGVPGAHVVLQLPKGATPTRDDIECCERLARGGSGSSSGSQQQRQQQQQQRVDRFWGVDVESDARRGPPGLAWVNVEVGRC